MYHVNHVVILRVLVIKDTYAWIRDEDTVRHMRTSENFIDRKNENSQYFEAMLQCALLSKPAALQTSALYVG